MRMALTGFVSQQAGSIASANSLFLAGLLQEGHEIVFFSKASFVDPRSEVGENPNFHFINVENHFADRARRFLRFVPLAGKLAAWADSFTYNRLLVQKITDAHARKPFDLCLWLGDYARGEIKGTPTISFVQGAPGSDARSVIRHFKTVCRLGGRISAWKWWGLARLRLSRLGLPPLKFSDHFIVGSSHSQKALQGFGISRDQISVVSYPIDLHVFTPLEAPRKDRALRCLWLGRIVPRKRLDLFLDAAALAIKEGTDLRLTIVGKVGFVAGYEKLIRDFPYPDRLVWTDSMARRDVPALLRAHDLLVQPSEDEDFGSSVAEAQACGLAVIVGAGSGNSDYLSARDLHLKDGQISTLASALERVAADSARGSLDAIAISRRGAETHFQVNACVARLQEILVTVCQNKERRSVS